MKGYHRVFKSQIVIFTVSYSKTSIYNLILIFIVSNDFIKLINCFLKKSFIKVLIDRKLLGLVVLYIKTKLE